MVTGSPIRPVVLCILDGWGLRKETDNNAIALAKLPNFRRMMATNPTGTLNASERHVGLPEGQMGNSEVGHMNLGAGRIVVPELPKIDNAIIDKSIFAKPELAAFVSGLQANGGTAHLMGLMSDGGVHSHQDHLIAVARHIAGQGVKVALHLFTDGRDTPPQSAQGFLTAFGQGLAGVEGISIATVAGRFFAMDRDKRWERVQAAYDAIVSAKGRLAATAAEAIAAGYAAGETDEFIQPTVIGGYTGFKDGDGLFMTNFRADRAREILSALLDPAFDGFVRDRKLAIPNALGMVEYSSQHAAWLTTMYPPQEIPNTIGEIVSKAGLKQLRIAETEKYAHVTFFFNGGAETVYPGEERILVPSPKVKTYDLQPEMSAGIVTEKLTGAIRSGTFDLIICNFANPDMVGHSGILEAAMKAVEAVDVAIGEVEAAVKEVGGALLVTADHGNVEQMIDPITGEPHTAHTLNLVPTILVNGPAWVKGLAPGRLADVAPTLLALLGLPQPVEMTGVSLLSSEPVAQAAE